ncbi:MAG: hypothetical protein R3C40_07390 [Parvularculaceae bacterium]
MLKITRSRRCLHRSGDHAGFPGNFRVNFINAIARKIAKAGPERLEKTA